MKNKKREGDTCWDELCSSQGIGKCVIRISVRGSEGLPRVNEEQKIDGKDNYYFYQIKNVKY